MSTYLPIRRASSRAAERSIARRPRFVSGGQRPRDSGGWEHALGEQASGDHDGESGGESDATA